MNYSEFLKELAEDLKEKLQSRNRNVEVEIVDVEKPWEWKIGLRISEGKRLCPVLYVDEQYEYYKAGMNYQMIVAYMTHKIEKALDKVPEKINLNFRDFRDTVTMQLLNTDRCEGYLKGKVCREVEDLSIIYRFNFDMGKQIGDSLELKKQIINYSKTRDIYVEYRKAGYSKKFLVEHREEIQMHKKAKETFENLSISKIPGVKELNQQISENYDKRRNVIEEYYQVKQEMRKMMVVRENVSRILNEPIEEKRKEKIR